MSNTERSQIVQYFLATLFGLITILITLGGAIGLVYGNLVPPATGAAGAWAIGAATALYVVPWLQRAFPELDKDGTSG